MTIDEAKDNMKERIKFLKSESRSVLSNKSKRAKGLAKEQESIEKILETLDDYRDRIDEKNEEIRANEVQYQELGKELQRYFKEVLKQDKMINLMAEQLKGKTVVDEYNQGIFELGDKEEVIRFFKNRT